MPDKHSRRRRSSYAVPGSVVCAFLLAASIASAGTPSAHRAGAPETITMRGAENVALVDVGAGAGMNESLRLEGEGFASPVPEATIKHCWRTAPGVVRCHLLLTTAGVERCTLGAEVRSRWNTRGRVAAWGSQTLPLQCTPV